MWFGSDLQLERNWSEVQAKVNAQVGIWLSRRLSLKGRAEECAVYVFPLILYWLAVLPLPKARWLTLKRSLSRLLWGGARPMVRRQVCIQCTHNGGLGMPDLESHWLAERLAYLDRSLMGDAVWRRKASRTFPRLKSDPKAEGRRKPLGEALLVRECRTALRNLVGSSDLSRPRKELYRELVVGSVSDPLSERRSWTAEEICSHWNWAPGSSFLNNSEFSLTWRFVQNALPLLVWTSERAWQTYPIALAAAVGWKKRLSTPSTTASKFEPNPSSSCCSTLVTSSTTFFLHFRVRSVWFFSWS